MIALCRVYDWPDGRQVGASGQGRSWRMRTARETHTKAVEALPASADADADGPVRRSRQDARAADSRGLDTEAALLLANSATVWETWRHGDRLHVAAL